VALAIGLVGAGVVVAVVVAPNVLDRSPAVASLCGEEVTGPAGLVGFDPGTGNVRWSREVGDAEQSAVTAGSVVTASATNRIVGIDGDRGAVRWCHQLLRPPRTDDQAPTLVASEGTAVVLAHGDVVGLDARTGEERWRRPVPADLSVHPVLSTRDGIVYVTGRHRAPTPASTTTTTLPATSSTERGTPPSISPPTTAPPLPSGSPIALDARTGGPVVEAPAPPSDVVFNEPLAGGGRVQALNASGIDEQQLVLSVRAPTGEIAWTKAVPGYYVAVRGDRILTLDQRIPPTPEGLPQKSVVHAFAMADGRELWATELDGVGLSLTTATGSALVGVGEETAAALALEDGKQRWQRSRWQHYYAT